MNRLTNDTADLVPRTDFAEPALEFDFPGLAIGCAEYDETPRLYPPIETCGGVPGVTVGKLA